MTLEDVDDSLAAKTEAELDSQSKTGPMSATHYNAFRIVQVYRLALKDLDAANLRDWRYEHTIAELRAETSLARQAEDSLRQQIRDDERAASEAATKLVKENSRLRMELMDIRQEVAELRSRAVEMMQEAAELNALIASGAP